MEPERIKDIVNKVTQLLTELAHDLPVPTIAEIDAREGIPHSGSPGVYFILSDNNDLLYVGKSERAVGARFWSHVVADPEEGLSWGWDPMLEPKPRRVCVFPLNEDQRCLAPALELLFIEEFGPTKFNVVNNPYRVTDSE